MRAPRDWAVDTAADEVVILHHQNSYLRYRMHLVDAKGDQTRDVIESRDGTVARLILRDGKPLTTDEDASERSRLDDLAASPGAFFKHVRNEDSGKKLAADLISMMPDAMLYTYAPGQPPSGLDHGDGEVVMDYHPNPNWTAPTTTSEGLTGLEGRMWIDTKSRQMLRMEGHIFKPVNFGWGMLAHIYPGGNLLLEQADAGGGRWIYTLFTQQISVRALMVKQMNVHTEVRASDFQTIGPLSYRDAIQMLLATPLPGK